MIKKSLFKSRKNSCKNFGASMKPFLRINLIAFLLFNCSLAIAQNNNTKVNHAPVFVKEMPDTFILAGKTLLFQYNAFDLDGDSITYSAKSVLPMNSTILSKTGVFSWRPFNAQRGMYELIIAASDGKLTTYSKRAILTTDFHIDFEPGTPYIAIAHNVGGEVSRSTIGDTAIVRAISNQGFRFTNWTEKGIVVSTDSIYKFVITVSRDLLANFRINRAPVFIKEMPDTTIAGGYNYFYTYKAIDPDGDSIKYYPQNNLPQNCVLLPTGFLAWRPANNQIGKHEVRVIATDGNLSVLSRISKLYVISIQDVNGKEEIPRVYSLGQNYPNPFNPETTIEYTIPAKVKSETAKVTMKVYDVLGREVTTLVDEYKSAGTYKVTFNTRHASTELSMASGVYFYRLQAGSYSETKKLILMK